MNSIRAMVQLSFRGYRTGRGSTSVGRSKAPGELEIQRHRTPGDVFDEEAAIADDLDAWESDFSNVAEIDRIYEREMKLAKSKLLTQIVKRKYFKTNEPAMLTWGEKEQIRFLHNEDPDEWTPEKLSDSFPASTTGILKVLRGKWSPKSPKVVEKYEQRVKDNWALFKAGKLDVDPRLAEHLEKFKDRKIKIMDTDIVAEKIVKPKPIFSKPKSTLFSDIIKSYLDQNQDDQDDELPDAKASNEKPSKLIGTVETIAQQKIEELGQTKSRRKNEETFTKTLTLATTTSTLATTSPKLATEREVSLQKTVTFDEFLHNHVGSIEENLMTPVDRVLVDELKHKSTENYKNKSLVFESESPTNVWNQQNKNEQTPSNVSKELSTSMSEREGREESLEIRTNVNNDVVAQERSEKSINHDLQNVLEGSLETGIIARIKTSSAIMDDYPEFIEIPPKKYKTGATYRVKDRYYDDDGEFLFRVPGLKS